MVVAICCDFKKMKRILTLKVSLKQIAKRFEEDEGNVFSFYEECLPVVTSFFTKIFWRMNDQQLKLCDNDGEKVDMILPDDPSHLHPTLLKILIIGVQRMILTSKCDLDCISDETWDHIHRKALSLRIMFR